MSAVFDRFMERVQSNLIAKECKKTGKTGCMGKCKDCYKQLIYNSTYARNLDSDLFSTEIEKEEPEVNGPFLVPEGSRPLTLGERVERYQEVYTRTGLIDTQEKNWVDIPYRKGDGDGAFGRTPLHDAVLDHDMQKIQSLLAADISVLELRDNNGHTPFHTALLEGDEQVIEFLSQRLSDS